MHSPESPNPVAAILATVCLSLKFNRARSFTWPVVAPASFQKKSNAVSLDLVQQRIIGAGISDTRRLGKAALLLRPSENRGEWEAGHSEQRTAYQFPAAQLDLVPHKYGAHLCFLLLKMIYGFVSAVLIGWRGFCLPAA